MAQIIRLSDRQMGARVKRESFLVTPTRAWILWMRWWFDMPHWPRPCGMRPMRLRLQDMDTNDLLIEVRRDIDKHLWFLEAHLQKAR